MVPKRARVASVESRESDAREGAHVHGPDCDHDHGEAQRPIRREAAKVGRNDPCPCGSGGKFKKCCGAQQP
jgi:uncharacterized protein YecA (UPF0149 family)